jgi:hypothetical protein
VLTQPTTFADITAATATINLTDLSQTYDGTAKSVSATTTPSGLSVTITYGGSANAPANAGEFAIVATITDPNYEGSASETLDVAKAGQTIAFDPISDTASDAPSFTVAATASSELPVFFVIESGPASIDGNTVTLTGAGEVMVRASQPGNANYNAAPVVDRSFGVEQATATVALDELEHVYDGGPKAATATTTPSGLAVVITYDGNAQAPIEPGRYLVEAEIDDGLHEGTASGIMIIEAPHELTFFGTIGEEGADGEFAAVVSPDYSSGTLIGYVPNADRAFVLEFSIQENGTFVGSTAGIADE